MEKSDKLPIPMNIPDRDEWVNGFGKNEGIITGISLIIGIIIGIVIFINTQDAFFAVTVPVAIVSITVIAVRKDPYNENFIDRIKIYRSYLKAQKQYEYEYHNIYEGVPDGTEE